MPSTPKTMLKSKSSVIISETDFTNFYLVGVIFIIDHVWSCFYYCSIYPFVAPSMAHHFPPPRGVGVSVVAWACRYARTGEALGGRSEKGKTWERRGKKWTLYIILYIYIKLCYIILYSPVSPINIYCHGKTMENNSGNSGFLSLATQRHKRELLGFTCLHSDFLWSHNPHPRNIVRWFSQPKTPIFFRDLQAFISFPCYVCWLTTPVN